MVETIVIVAIVGAAAVYLARRALAAGRRRGGCGGCGCEHCHDTSAAPCTDRVR